MTFYYVLKMKSRVVSVSVLVSKLKITFQEESPHLIDKQILIAHQSFVNIKFREEE